MIEHNIAQIIVNLILNWYLIYGNIMIYILLQFTDRHKLF